MLRSSFAAPVTVATLVAAVVPALRAAQSPSPRRLGTPTAELSESFSSVAGLRELSDGRVVLLDSRERAVWLTDAAFATRTRLGREGSGPGEYTRPSGLAALPADTTWIIDGGNRRNLVIAPNGKIPRDEAQLTIRPSEGVTYTVTPRGTDAQGRLYMTLPLGLIDRGPDDKGETPILRYDRRTSKFDTVATFVDRTRIRLTPGAGQPVGGGAGGTVRMGFSTGGTGYMARDEWTVAPDGAVALIRAEPYRIDWKLPDGTLRQGQAVGYTKVRVRDAEKQELLDELKARGGATLTTRGADGRTQTQSVPAAAPQSWEEFKPPFVGGTAVAAPNGTVWVLRSAPAGEKEGTWDVFDRAGTLVDRVVLPKRSRVVGFGNGRVYVARYDEDDLMYVARYALR